MKSYLSSHVGVVRKNNEDSGKIINLANGMAIFVVADGVGGYQKGEVASRLAIEYVQNSLEQNQEELLRIIDNEKQIITILENAVCYANDEIVDFSAKKGNSQMGTTIVVAINYKNKLYVANVGDSRLYIQSSENGQCLLRQVTKDNSFVQEMVDIGYITQEEAKTHPRRNMITRAVGINHPLMVDFYVEELKKNDMVLLCSDGLTGMISDNEINEVLCKKITVEEKVEQLIEKAIDAGGHDNVTVLCVEIDEVGV